MSLGIVSLGIVSLGIVSLGILWSVGILGTGCTLGTMCTVGILVPIVMARTMARIVPMAFVFFLQIRACSETKPCVGLN